MTADRPEVSSSRSSRTRDKSPQESTPTVDREPTCLTLLFMCSHMGRTVTFLPNTFEIVDVQSLRALMITQLPSVLPSRYFALGRVPPILVNFCLNKMFRTAVFRLLSTLSNIYILVVYIFIRQKNKNSQWGSNSSIVDIFRRLNGLNPARVPF